MTVQDVYDNARALLQGGQTSQSMGLGNGVMQGAFNQAYTEMWQAMAQLQVPRVRREFYCLIPAFTSYLDPVTAGIVDMGEPELMYERGNLTSVAITSTGTTSPIAATTVVPHNLAANADVTIGQVSNTQKPCGRWFVTVTGPTTLTLNGSVSDNVAGTGGTLTTSPERFQNHPVGWLREMRDPQVTSPRLRVCLWEEGVFQFPGANAPAQIKVTYLANAAPPQNTTLNFGVPEGGIFVSNRMASIMARTRGLYQMADALKLDALGPGGQADGSGGLLSNFLSVYVNGMQRNEYRQPPFNSWGYWSNIWSGGTAFGGGFTG